MCFVGGLTDGVDSRQTHGVAIGPISLFVSFSRSSPQLLQEAAPRDHCAQPASAIAVRERTLGTVTSWHNFFPVANMATEVAVREELAGIQKTEGQIGAVDHGR